MKFSIRRKMMLLILLPIVLIFIFFRTFDITKTKEWVTRLVEDRMNELVLNYADRFDSHLEEIAQIARSTATSMDVDPQVSTEQIYSHLKENVKADPLVYGAAMAFEPYQFDPKKRLFSPYVYRKGKELMEMDIGVEGYDYTALEWKWWNKPKEEGVGVWTEPYFDKGAGNILMSTYSAPFYKNGKFLGVTTVDIALEPLNKLLDQRINKEIDFDVFTRGGQFVLSPNPKYIMQESLPQLVERKQREDLKGYVSDILQGQPGFFKAVGWDSGEREWIFYAPIKSADWIFLAKIPEKKALEIVNQQIVLAFIIFSGALFLIIFSIWISSVFISRPIGKLNQAALEIANGNLNIQAQVKSNDEIGTLADSFNRMTGHIQKRIRELMCFYNVSKIADTIGLDLKDIFQRVVELMPSGWKYSERAGARIVIDGAEYQTASFKETPWMQSSEIRVFDQPRGKVDICYSQKISSDGEEIFLKEEQNLLNVIAEKMGRVVERFEMEQKIIAANKLLEQMSITDALTGVYNRRYLTDRLSKEIMRLGRTNNPLSLITIDIDHFKTINDTHGHDRGDQVIVHVANIFKATVRETDVVTRYGGDEFFIIAPDTSKSNAGILADRLVTSVRNTAFTHGDLNLNLTISLGASSLEPKEIPDKVLIKSSVELLREKLMKDADNALYEAKRSGRNRFCIG